MNWLKSQLCKFFGVLCVKPQDTTSSNSNILVTKNIEYSKGFVKVSKNDNNYSLVPLYMDMYELKTDARKNRDCIILVHGGHFKDGDKENSNFVKMITEFVNKGYVCFSINYRLEGSNPPGTGVSLLRAMNAAIVDVKSAIRFIQFNWDEEYNIDPNKVVVLGESAGAVACITAAISDKNEYLKDVDDPEFPVQNAFMVDGSKKPIAIASLWGAATLSLAKFDKLDPPIFIAHGTKDMTIGASYLESIAMAQVCKDKGVTYEFHSLEGFDHGAWDATIDGLSLANAIMRFIDKIKKGP